MNWLKTQWRGWCKLRMIEQITVISHVCVIVASLAGIAFFMLERRDAEQQLQREMALEMFALSYTPEIREAKLELNAFLEENVGRMSEERRQVAGGAPVLFSLSEGERQTFLQNLEFYDQILICRKLEQCDAKMIDTMFQRDMCDFDTWMQVVMRQLADDYRPEIDDRLRAYCAALDDAA